MKAKNWEVGSTWYADNYNSDDGCHSQLRHIEAERGVTLLSTCRSAISTVLNHVGQGKRALVPSFTCHSVVSPFVDAGYQVKGYPLNENLQIDIEELSSIVDSFRPDVILIHGYFGFDTVGGASKFLKKCRTQGVVVIEDMTQTMFSTFTRPASDYTVGSIRKWFPVPDGAFLSNIRLNGLSEDYELAKAKIEAMRAKNNYIVNGNGAKDFMPKFSAAENILDSRTQPFAISSYTLSALNDVDLYGAAQLRRNNYNLLVARILQHHEISIIFPKATEDVVPFLLPVYIREGRSEFQKYMAQHNVYPTIIWECPEELEKELYPAVQNIYNNILCFHIDQRYDKGDMSKVADIIDSYFNQKQ